MIGKIFFVVCCLIVTVLAGEKYTDKYDNVNIQEIIETDRLFDSYLKCMLDTGKCTPDGKELRDNLQEALETGCEKCTEVQKEKSEVAIKLMIEKKPAAWNELCAKYDPKGEMKKKYEDLAKEHGIVLP